MTIQQIFKKHKISTLGEMAKILGLKEDTLLKRILRGKYDAIQLGKGRRTFWLIKEKKIKKENLGEFNIVQPTLVERKTIIE